MSEAEAALTPGRRIFYGWWVLAGAVAAMALGSGVSFWSFQLYIDPLESQFGWSRAEVSLGFSLSLLIAGLTGPLVGRWVDARGARSSIIVGGALAALSYLLLATTASLWQWYLYNSINAVFRQLMFFIPFQALLTRWFDRRRGLALGVLATGFSMGGFIVVPVMRAVIDTAGWDGSFIVSGGLVAALFLPMGLLLIRNSPAEVGAFPDGEPPPVGDEPPRTSHMAAGLTLAEALRAPYFWVLAAAMTLFFYGMFGWLVHLVPFYESIGVSRGLAALLVSAAAGCGIISRILFGLLADRIDRLEHAAMGLLALLMAAVVALIVDSGAAGIAVFIVFWVAGSGGGPLLEPLLLPRAFGLAHFGAILGTFGVIETIGLIASPAITGWIFDTTGSYDWALVMFVAAHAAAFVLFYLAARMPRPLAAAPPPVVAARWT